MSSSSLIIPTYNREYDLSNCLHSVLAQTRLPDQLIIVDDGRLMAVPLWKELQQAGISCHYVRKDKPGLTESRNLGVSLAKNEILFFLDDDVILEPNYLAEIMRVYEGDPERTVGGVGGAITNKPKLTLLHKMRRIWNIPFFVCGIHEGRVLPSGFGTDFGTTPFPLTKLSEVDFLDGGVSSFRRDVFDQFVFTDAYRRYGFGEDKDFSYRISRNYRLLYTPKAQLVHLESSTMRPDMRTWGRKFIIGRWLFFRDYLQKGKMSRMYYCWAVFGYLLDRVIIAGIKRSGNEWQRVLGILDAVKILLSGRLEP
ncbi:glycosyltransferase family 2 protein [Maridesulfovibrio sp.]|uniref:glycosyltransferase family 2 protein n=1 Tax=Maridesulfovibrio sp. TaxID=2795000 RepID=UPI003BAC9867